MLQWDGIYGYIQGTQELQTARCVYFEMYACTELDKEGLNLPTRGMVVISGSCELQVTFIQLYEIFVSRP